jgi:hypothetical protein
MSMVPMEVDSRGTEPKLSAKLAAPDAEWLERPCPSSNPALADTDYINDQDKTWKSKFTSEEQWRHFVSLPLTEAQRNHFYSHLQAETAAQLKEENRKE